MTTVLKLRYQTEIRRVLLQPEELSFDGVKKLSQSVFPKLQGQFSFWYRDEEGDFIHVVNEREFAEAVRVFGNSEAHRNLFLSISEIPKKLKDEECNPCGSCPLTRFKSLLCGRSRGRSSCCFLNPSVLILFVGLFILFGCRFLIPAIFAFVGIKIAKRFFGRRRGCRYDWKSCSNNNQWREFPIQEELPQEVAKSEEPHNDQPERPDDKEEEEVKVGENTFAKKLRQLEEMGFVDRERNISLLVKHKADIVQTIKDLLE